MSSKSTRRLFLASGSAAAAAVSLGNAPAISQEGNNSAERSSDDYPRTHVGRGGPIGSDTDRGKLVSGFRSPDDPPARVTMSDLETLPWNMIDGVKEYHLIAEHVRREVLPDQWFDFWGYNTSMPGPLIEAVEGDRVRIRGTQ